MKALSAQISHGLSSRQVIIALIVAALFQGVVLVAMYGLSALPLITGTEIRIKTIPVDPRSLFRGNYARLRYEISTIDAERFSVHQQSVENDDRIGARLRQGEVVYVSLEPGEQGLYEFSGVQLTPPNEGVYLRGRVLNYSGGDQPVYHIKYGIEAFFAPKVKALALERELRDSGVAVLKVSSSGSVRLEDVVTSETN
ncbi:GDYXXLXY domain-containing protein [Pseudomaricurvus sp.]|uniref:GDYXXLXY domain-containing protein n=1 Tax=Pseudomaricurvus sp. TaxID=2004510 RepID=UPI003F6C0991